MGSETAAPPGGIFRHRFTLPILLLLAGLIHSLLYVWLVPPWQHYDEPTQFEYAWLLANRAGQPKSGDYDQGMRREVAASMIEFGFFRTLDYRSNLISQDQPVWIGISQTGDRPLYYGLVSLPLRLVRGSDVTFQLILGRLVSLMLSLVSIAAAYGIATALAPAGHPLRWMAPLALALLPGFTELMTAVNNDVGATAFFSLFLWAGVLLLQGRFSWGLLAACGVFALACLWTKSTVVPAVVLAAIPALFSLVPRQRWWLAWLGLLAASIAAAFILLEGNEAALWYRKGSHETPTRSTQANAPLGEHNLVLVQSPGKAPVQLIHLVAQGGTLELAGRTVTLGGWVWASQPARIQAPALYDGGNTYSRQINVGTRPVFFATQVKLTGAEKKLSVILAPGVTNPGEAVSVYYDGLVLVKGKWPVSKAPDFTGAGGEEGVWGGRTFSNLIRNGSAEQAWIRLRPKAEEFLDKNFPVFSAGVLASLKDRPGAGWYYRVTAKTLLETFWGKFGWGQIALPGRYTYRFLGVLTLAGILGGLVLLLRRWGAVPKPALLFLSAACLAIWGLTFFRGIGSVSGQTLFPAARYAYPAIIPTMLLLSAGWLEITRPVARRWPALRALPVALFLVFFLALDAASLWSVWQFYR